MKEFKCPDPNCGSTRLEEVMTDCIVTSEILAFDESGPMEYGVMLAEQEAGMENINVQLVAIQFQQMIAQNFANGLMITVKEKKMDRCPECGECNFIFYNDTKQEFECWLCGHKEKKVNEEWQLITSFLEGTL